LPGVFYTCAITIYLPQPTSSQPYFIFQVFKLVDDPVVFDVDKGMNT